MLPRIEIIVGTYTDYLVGYRVTQKRIKGVDKTEVKQTFADKSHAGSLRCVAAHGPWIASGGSDDRIFIYDMRIRKLSQVLASHTGTINGLVFSPELTHLLSASDDGHLLVTRIGSWTIEADFRKAHGGGPVTQIACHPTSRLALSLGNDLILNTWNLVRGRIAYRTNVKSKRTLGNAPHGLAWSPDGTYFSLCGPRVVEIWNIESATVALRNDTPSKPICAAWYNGRNLLAGLESGYVAWLSLDDYENQDTTLIRAHDTRVKGIAALDGYLVTISSAGEIRIWTGDCQEKTLTQLASVNTGCRPTCLALLDLHQFGLTDEDYDIDDVGDVGEDQEDEEAVHSDQEEHDDADQEEDGEQDEELNLIRPRSFVSIEYDNDDKSDTEGENNQQKLIINSDSDLTEYETGSTLDSSDTSDESDESDESKKLPPNKNSNKKQLTAKPMPNGNNSELSDSESESDSDSDSEDSSEISTSEDERSPDGGPKGNKRKGNLDHKLRAKQAK